MESFRQFQIVESDRQLLWVEIKHKNMVASLEIIGGLLAYTISKVIHKSKLKDFALLEVPRGARST